MARNKNRRKIDKKEISNSGKDRVELCNMCGDGIAVWFYPDSDRKYCDYCVSKGCSCSDDPIDPCVDFLYFENGIEI